MRIADCGLRIVGCISEAQCTFARSWCIALRLCTLLLLILLAGLARAQSSTVAPLIKLLESGRVPAERQAAIVEMICTRGEAADLAVVCQAACQARWAEAGCAAESRSSC